MNTFWGSSMDTPSDRPGFKQHQNLGTNRATESPPPPTKKGKCMAIFIKLTLQLLTLQLIMKLYFGRGNAPGAPKNPCNQKKSKVYR